MFLYATERGEHASTYATAHSLLALNELLSRRLLSPEQVDAVNDSIRIGSSWLITRRDPSQARWWDYPLSSKRKISQSLSGLVIFTMHKIRKGSFASIDRQWLEELPDSLPAADACEISFVWTDTLDGPYQDHNCQLSLAWLLAATADAYPNGTLIQKVKALAWVERVLETTNILRSETFPDNWKRTEVLISLKHLVRN